MSIGIILALFEFIEMLVVFIKIKSVLFEYVMNICMYFVDDCVS